MAASGDGSGYLLTLVSPMFISSQKRRLRARHMSVPLQPQIFAAMAFVTHWVKCAAVGTPDRSRTCRERSASIAFCRIIIHTEFEQFAVNPWGPPGWVRSAHHTDQIAYVLRNRRTPGAGHAGTSRSKRGEILSGAKRSRARA